MRIFERISLICCGLFIFFQSRAQDFFSQIDTAAIKYYTQSDGLPFNDIYDVVEDGRGFLWVATAEGLSRFDGRKFENFFQTARENFVLKIV